MPQKIPKKHFLMFSLSFIFFFVFWFTNYYYFFVLKIITFGTTNSILSPVWTNLRKQMNVYIFNYTNIEGFINGNESKIKIEEIGPYVYKDVARKDNFKKFEGFTTFDENITLTFSQSESKSLSENDTFITPNLILLSAIPEIIQMGSFAEFGLSTLVRFMKIKQFEEVQVRNFLFGYSNDFIDLALKFKKNFTTDMVGVLTRRTGVKNWNVTFDPSDFNPLKINSVNGKTKMNAWKSEKCNKIHGSDGFYVNAENIWKREKIFAFLPFLCMAFPLDYAKEGSFFYLNTPSLIYELSHDIYTRSSPNYCRSKSPIETPYDGLFDLSTCQDIPVFLSHPHFLYADPKVSELFEGLNPTKGLHLSAVHMHPGVAIPLGGNFRFQFNIKVSHFRENYEKFPNGMVLPVVWVDLCIDVENWMLFRFYIWLSKFVGCFELLGKFGSIFGIFYFWFKILNEFWNYELKTEYESVDFIEKK